jgi:DNA sulfur modification protein DndD
LLERLAPSVSHAFRLDYDQGQGLTRVMDGYFGDEEEEAERADAVQQA